MELSFGLSEEEIYEMTLGPTPPTLCEGGSEGWLG